MNRVVIRLPKRKEVLVFKLRGNQVVCNAPELQKLFMALGILHLNGHHYFPKDGTKFLEAIYDYYFISQIGVGYPKESP